MRRVAIVAIAAIFTASPASAQMQTFSDSQGNFVGSSAQIGSNIRNYYDANDSLVVSSMRSGNVTSYFDGQGNLIGNSQQIDIGAGQ